MRLGDEIARESSQLAPRQPRADEHAVGLILALLYRRAELVQLRKLSSFLVGQEEMDGLVAVREAFRDTRPQLTEALAGEGRDLDRLGETICEPPPVQRVGRVDLVDHDFEREVVGADVVQDRSDRGRVLLQPLLRNGGVDDVQHEVGDERLLERGRKALDELRREAADESDRVGDEIPAALVPERSRGRIERLEEPVVHGDLGLGQRVQEGRLADVRVAGERNGRRLRAPAFLAADVALLAQIAKPAAQDRDAATREPAVGLELRLARTARSDSAPEALEVLPHPAHARQVVLELGQLDLQLSFRADRMLREDVEDQLSAIDDARLQRVLERALLCRLELAVHEQHLCAGATVVAFELLELALPDVRTALGSRTVLDELADRLDEGGVRELSQLRQLVLGIDTLSQHGDDEPALERGVRLALDHRRIMPATRQNPSMAADDLARRTLELVDIPSESRNEAEIAAYVRAAVSLPTLFASDDVLFVGRRRGLPLVVLAGHLDTVPAQDNLPGHLADGVVHGLGASDMKGGLAVMIELARTLRETALDVAYLFFVREELAAGESALPAFFSACPDVHEAALVVMLEPTDNEIHAGCLGNLNTRLAFAGVSAHSARPWTGDNAIHRALRALAAVARLEPDDVEVEGLVFREVVSVVRIEGGIAQNVVPDRAVAELNYRYAPSRTPEEAVRRLRELVPEGTVETLANSPPAHVVVDTPLARRLREAGSFAIQPKQAWTPVAEFAAQGLDAVNLGPGATRYAHRRDEQVEVTELVRTYEALQRFLGTV